MAQDHAGAALADLGRSQHSWYIYQSDPPKWAGGGGGGQQACSVLPPEFEGLSLPGGKAVRSAAIKGSKVCSFCWRCLPPGGGGGGGRGVHSFCNNMGLTDFILLFLNIETVFLVQDWHLTGCSC